MSGNDYPTIKALRKAALRNRQQTWYKEFCSHFDSSNTRTAWLFFKEREFLLNGLAPITGWYPGRPGPAISYIHCWVLRNPTVNNECKFCKGVTRLNTTGGGYRPFCSIKCMSIGVVDKRRQTCIQKYGADNPSRVDTIKTKRRKTFIERLGCSNPYQNEEIKAKIRKTIQANYGVDNPSQSKVIKRRKEATSLAKFGYTHWTKDAQRFQAANIAFDRSKIEKSRETYLLKTGYANPLLNPAVQQKLKRTNKRRYGYDNIFKDPSFGKRLAGIFMEKYGVDNPRKAESVKAKIAATNLERYGVKHPAVFHGWTNTRKVAVDKNGKVHSKLQGYEDQVVHLLNRRDSIRSIDSGRHVPTVLYKDQHNKTRTYYPDLLVTTRKDTKVVLEVKSIFTLNLNIKTNLRKFRAATKLGEREGFKFMVAVKVNENFVVVRTPHFMKNFREGGVPINKSSTRPQW